MPHSEINYEAESFLSGKVKIRISLEYLSSMRSAIRIDAGLNMNPLLRMLIGDSAGKYLETLMDLIESYGGMTRSEDVINLPESVKAASPVSPP